MLLVVTVLLLPTACALPGKGTLASARECADGTAPVSRCVVTPPALGTIYIEHE